MKRSRSWVLLVSLGLGLLAPSLSAYTRPLAFEIPDGQEAAYEVPFEVEHPGTLVIDAQWTGSRIISFRVEGPGDPATRVRRTGPSPQRIEIPISEGLGSMATSWKLLIRALASRGEAKATVRVELPDSPEVMAQKRAAETPPPPPPPEPEPWTLKSEAPAGAVTNLVAFFEAVERYRVGIVRTDGTFNPDPCGWRTDLLRYLANARDQLDIAGSPPSASTLRFLDGLSRAVRHVEELRISKDPLLIGPIPENSRRVWSMLHKEQIRPLQRELDALTESLRGGTAPDLEKAAWPPRFVACLTACERHFEDRATAGEEAAVNGDLARAQWGSFLAASSALDALARAGR